MKIYLVFKADFPTDFDGELLYAYLSSNKASDKITELEQKNSSSNFYTRTIETSDVEEILLSEVTK
jgi:hypothetical protein